tara:strand:- start:2352 stop:2474 length:123 start_codon:yes stop_codon:yes gene_type:complete
MEEAEIKDKIAELRKRYEKLRWICNRKRSKLYFNDKSRYA